MNSIETQNGKRSRNYFTALQLLTRHKTQSDWQRDWNASNFKGVTQSQSGDGSQNSRSRDVAIQSRRARIAVKEYTPNCGRTKR